MSSLNWLHLSDWHQGRADAHNRTVILEEILNDIRTRVNIDSRLQHIDFIVFSGDISFSGENEQFHKASKELIEPILQAVGTNRPLYVVPGNHDLQRSSVKDIPREWAEVVFSENDASIEDLLRDEIKLSTFKKPLANFYHFAGQHGCTYGPNQLYLTNVFEKENFKIGIICLNTVWHSARFELKPTTFETRRVWDHGVLRITEGQVRAALRQLGNVDIAIAIMHHPLYWLAELDQAKVEQQLGSHCHIVLHGHEHRPNMSRISNAFGETVTIPAGACYDRRIAHDPRYTNAYNFCSLNLKDYTGTVFHRIWAEDHSKWVADERFWADGRSIFFIQKKQDSKQQKLARKSLNILSREYLTRAYKRTARLHEITLRHTAEEIGGELFIRAHRRIRAIINPGDPERSLISAGLNSRIAVHPNEAVRNNALRIIKIEPEPTCKTIDKEGLTSYVDLGCEEQEMYFECENLETTDGVYMFSLLRFTEQLKFTWIKDPYFEYECLSFGGLPPLKPFEDTILKADVWETELSLPNQGFLVQWYPKMTKPHMRILHPMRRIRRRRATGKVSLRSL